MDVSKYTMHAHMQGDRHTLCSYDLKSGLRPPQWQDPRPGFRRLSPRFSSLSQEIDEIDLSSPDEESISSPELYQTTSDEELEEQDAAEDEDEDASLRLALALQASACTSNPQLTECTRKRRTNMQ